ncbi:MULTISPECIES: heavy metal translocating P-type ATPase [Pseudomonas syringae group]|uniref:Copper-translocating P-type ATPase n=1 Tax=Pseudomonas savastanoi pv. phaseolicola TaxID=319 RepID=A0A7Z6UX57_PSESH|nr:MULTISPECIES: heavy metal translocating P-type ATPase [Pseudomonas syringae group]PYD14772.1 cadmium-translocating P-type ATPase [Pseudomonas syringae pv. pisi]PYD31111.1 cadmium-translocating P-type ATPase [Pseudomonas syringae pv. pisi]PYD33137.1 cadmium-translocating P-type ATPase [Pseudomonas syringae pv. pisi]RML51934.1 Copper-translocating P-type ATPase [Pseudomonas syringae pv. pisi]RML66037.1 Copper-translocating P-type ATPase [Pseudomonas syringae pv. pisi]
MARPFSPAPVHCYHCGLPVPAGSHFNAVVLGATRQLCCPGCQAVAEAIVASGLDNYYRHRSETSANPESLPSQLLDELALYDRPDVQAPFVRHDGDLSEATLLVEGISCAACGWLIEQRLGRLPAVTEARMNLSTHRLLVRWNADQLALSQLLNELHAIGYVAHPWQADRAAERMASDNRLALRQLGVAGLLWFQAMMATMATWPEFNIDLSPQMHTILRWVALFLTTPIVFYSCAPFFSGAWRDLRSLHLTMDVSVSLAIGAAYAAGIWTAVTGAGELYFDAVGMFALFLLAGRYLERRARERTAAATAQLVNVLPASCLRLSDDGQSQRIMLSELRLADRVLVQPGAVIPADGKILEGHSSVDESLLTGEYLPQMRSVGDAVTAGTLNVESPLTVAVTALGHETRLSAIVRLLERAQAEKPRLAQIADRAAQAFLLLSLIAAALIGVIWWQLDASRAFWIVLAMLVATCPCALSLATPTALTAATGTLHTLGLLLTRGHVLEGLNQIDTVIFDKTGTLTEGRLTLRGIHPLRELDANRCLELAAALENRSEHPIARAFGRAPTAAEEVLSTPGLGLQGRVDGHLLRIGEAAFVCALSDAETPLPTERSGQWLLLGDTQGPLAWLVLDDRLREDAGTLLHACRARGWKTLLLSGDSSPMVDRVAQALGIDEARGGMRPDDKLEVLRQLQAQGRKVLMIGDGVNDVPVMAAADISVAMGSATDLAKTSADAVLLCNRLPVLIDALNMARRTRSVIIENLLWAGLYNGLMLPFAALGWITPVWAAIGMSLSSLTVVLNALRLTRLPRHALVPPSAPEVSCPRFTS